MTLSHGVIFLVRLGLVALFLPFSVLDKVIGFRNAVKQARQAFSGLLAPLAIIIGVVVELVMSLGVLTGVMDQFCALILAAYCVATACLFKQFWRCSDLLTSPDGQGRTLFWDFMKNLSVASGFLLIVVGTTGVDFERFIAHPLSSSRLYAGSDQP